MKTILGFLAIVFGIAGVLLAVSAGVGGWWIAATVADRTDKAAGRVSQCLDGVETAQGRMEAKVNAAAKALEKAQQSAEAIASGAAKDDPALKARVNDLLNSLGPLLEQADSLAEAIRSVVALLESAAELVGPVIRDPARRERLRSIGPALSQAAASLESVRDEATALRRGEAVPTAGKISDLTARGQPPLKRLAEGLAEAREQPELLRAELEELRRAVRFWSVASPAVLTLILIWFGLGQLCIVGWGRRQLAAPTQAA